MPSSHLARRALLIAALTVAELFFISILYRFETEFACRASAPDALCGFLSGSVLRAVSVFGMLAVFVWARPSAPRALWAGAAPNMRRWLAVQGVGVALILAPWLFLAAGSPPAIIALAMATWAVGAVLAVLGTLLAVAPPASWAAALRNGGPLLALGLGAAMLSPELARLFAGIWHWDRLSEATFQTVLVMLDAVGMEVTVDLARRTIGADGFDVSVAQQCSGVEGLLLITLFLAFYLSLFRAELRFPRVLLLLPIGLALSWTLNSVRIAALIWIGAHVSPDLAVNGFHSHAGWLLFSTLSMALIAASRLVPWFAREPHAAPADDRPALPPLSQDRNAAEILPFVVFLASSLVASTFSHTPAVHYPLRAAAMAAALWMFRRLYLRLEWRLDPLSIAAGATIGAMWLAAQVTGAAPGDAGPAPLTGALMAMSPAAFAIWATARVIGTTALAPMIEELFFRGYLLRRLDIGGTAMRVVALAVSSGLFAALHDRWLLAAIAGLAFGLLALRRGRVTDAVQAHVAANGLIAVWAVMTGDWTVI
ncbi:MAG: exosortase E/protease (VPEID-CTERM system) [Paracoccaceae bacterium]|jgi:exosortase E/protease (VPEID-CTERM system)